eukprot:5749254-Pleurochrysis_carterae.AAC.7
MRAHRLRLRLPGVHGTVVSLSTHAVSGGNLATASSSDGKKSSTENKIKAFATQIEITSW